MRLITKYLILFLVLSGNNLLFSQNGANPFELKHRQETTAAEEEKAADIELIKTDNPFDIAEQPIVKANRPKSPPKKEPTKELSETANNYLFWVFFTLLAFFTTILGLSRKKLEQSYRAFFNDNYCRQLHRANQGRFSLGYLLLYILFFFNLGLFIFLLVNNYGEQLSQSLSTLSLICLGVGVAFAGKHLLLFFIEKVFPFNKEIKLYSFTIMIFSIVLGIILLPINVFAAFAPEDLKNIVIIGGLGAILATYLFRSLRGISIGSRHIMLHTFHFLLYLCAVEILPLVVLLKFVLLWIE